MKGQQKRVLETLRKPEVALEGDFGEKLATRFYRKTPVTSKFLVVPYREIGATDGFVITAYFARRLSQRRRRLWTQ
jgi:hypothetical protein